MQEKPKRKPKNNMSRRRFLQVGVATVSVGIGAAIAAQWANSPSMPPTPNFQNCSFSWAANQFVAHEDDTALLREALEAAELDFSDAEVQAQAMEYLTCYDEENNIVSSELLTRPSSRAAVVFVVEDDLYHDATLRSYAEDVQNAIAHIENFPVRSVEVFLVNGDETIMWEVPFPDTPATQNP